MNADDIQGMFGDSLVATSGSVYIAIYGSVISVAGILMVWKVEEIL